jgi:rod shape-determining protein MreC
LALLLVLAVVLALVYTQTQWLGPLKQKAIDLASPFYWLTNMPREMSAWSEQRLVPKEQLLQENQALRTELLIQQHRAQQMAAVVAENTRLRQLLNSADKIENRVLVAELTGVAPDPMLHRMLINRGLVDGVYLGQPVVDALGLMGQVVEVGERSSWVILITDTSHALPVQINRNGARLVAEGRGNLYQLALRHVPNTFDIQEGDLLVSSGLGKRFPSGYPVAVVESIKPDKSSPWAEVIAKPLAELNRNRHVLLVFEEAPQLETNLAPGAALTGSGSSGSGAHSSSSNSTSSSSSTSNSSSSSSSSSASSSGKPNRRNRNTSASSSSGAQAVVQPNTQAIPQSPQQFPRQLAASFGGAQ